MQTQQKINLADLHELKTVLYRTWKAVGYVPSIPEATKRQQELISETKQMDLQDPNKFL
jgi:hypothetical protein